MRAKPKSCQTATLFLIALNSLVCLATSQGQSGFISLDCGSPENSTYAEASTGITYISDAAFVVGGESKSVSAEYRVKKQQQVLTVRSFPKGIRNCYNTSTRKGTAYLIRATFFYGNYDAKNSTPVFDLHLGPNFWDTVKFSDAAIPEVREIVHSPARSYVRVCLANTGSGTPFISALELRPIKNGTYEAPAEVSLGLVARYDVGSNTTISYRYPYDELDRLWTPYLSRDLTRVSTSEAVVENTASSPPTIVMSSAASPLNASDSLRFNMTSADVTTAYYLHLHFAELHVLRANESRSFNFLVNDKFWFGEITPGYLSTKTIVSSKAITGELAYNFELQMAENSTLPPILNAIEIYVLVDASWRETQGDDVAAITDVKLLYGVERNWDGDPCLPVNYLWAGLDCSVDSSNASRITSLNLSSSGLTGEISTHISNLIMLESLDLSNNELTGSVPDFLHQMTNLKVLNLASNNLTGILPAELLEKSNQGSLSLKIDKNQGLCATSPCKKTKKKKVIVPIAASVGGLLAVFIAGAAFFITRTKKRRQVILGKRGSNFQTVAFESNKRLFSYNEIVKITKNFSRILGKGGFATVYHGVLGDGTEVAVKKIRIEASKGSRVQSQSSNRKKKDEAEEQYQQFQAEVKLLLTVYHGSLTSLVGYCNQGIERVLIYEYMANGDLESHLSGKQSHVLDWETRLQIAIDSGQGLEYLHSGCKPPIIHRDIKAANILITDKYRAKLADFGLSKFFLTDDGTHVSTMHVAGTPGYMDPDLANNGLLNEKTDVYSFGVVILQLITSRPTISKKEQGDLTHLSDWVRIMVDNGNIKQVIDERLRGDFEINSVWKAVEIAMACVSLTTIERPNMTKVVIELRECLALEKARKVNCEKNSCTWHKTN